MRKHAAQAGQALVMVLLSLAVVLTLVLFILARSTTDIAVSSKSEEATRAFSAAEAGIENALVIGTGTTPGSPVNIGDASYTSTVTGHAKGSTEFNAPSPLYSGESVTTWFVSHDSNGNIECTDGECFSGSSMKVCWGSSGTPDDSATTPAIEVSIFYKSDPGSLLSTKIARVTADPNSGRAASNKFSGIDGGCNSITSEPYAFQKTIDFASLGIPAASYGVRGGLQFARIRMLYNSDKPHLTGVTVAGSGTTLPSQGTDIISVGTAGQSNRRVAVFRGWPEVPSVFDSAVFSSGGLSNGLSGPGATGLTPTVDSFSVSYANHLIILSYSNISAPTTGDWAAFYTGADDPDSSFIDWRYITSTGTCDQDNGDGVKSGSCSFIVPATLPPGNYDVRLFSSYMSGENYIKMASAPITIPEVPPVSISASYADGLITVTYSGIQSPTPTDWVGIYSPGADDGTNVGWVYVKSSGTCPRWTGGDGLASGSCSFYKPYRVSTGTYDVRLFTNKTFIRLATSTLSIP